MDAIGVVIGVVGAAAKSPRKSTTVTPPKRGIIIKRGFASFSFVQ